MDEEGLLDTLVELSQSASMLSIQPSTSLSRPSEQMPMAEEGLLDTLVELSQSASMLSIQPSVSLSIPSEQIPAEEVELEVVTGGVTAGGVLVTGGVLEGGAVTAGGVLEGPNEGALAAEEGGTGGGGIDRNAGRLEEGDAMGTRYIPGAALPPWNSLDTRMSSGANLGATASKAPVGSEICITGAAGCVEVPGISNASSRRIMLGTIVGCPKSGAKTSAAERKISRMRGPLMRSGMLSPSSSNSARRCVEMGSVKKFSVLPRRFTDEPRSVTPTTNPAYAPISP